MDLLSLRLCLSSRAATELRLHQCPSFVSDKGTRLKLNIWKGNPNCLSTVSVCVYVYVCISGWGLKEPSRFGFGFRFMPSIPSLEQEESGFCQRPRGKLRCSPPRLLRQVSPRGCTWIIYSLFTSFLSRSFVHQLLTEYKKGTRIGLMNKIYW